jgi:hypothetical protein
MRSEDSANAAQLANAPAERYIPFKGSSTLDLENKKRLAEAPKRRSRVRAASIAGDVQSVLSFLETIQVLPMPLFCFE